MHVAGDFPAIRPHYVHVGHALGTAALSPTGARAAFEAHGEIFTVPVEHGDIRDLNNTPGVAERYPAWSPDGKHIAYFSDESGEYALHIKAQDGVGDVRKIDLGKPSFFYSPVWSPDSKKIAYTDKRLNLWLVEVDGGHPVLVDSAPYDSGFDPAWSPDSRYLAYARSLNSKMGAVFVYDVGGKSRHQVTDGRSDASSAVFDKNGKYLYFIASTDDGPAVASSMAAHNVPVTSSGYLVVLNKNQKSPLSPLSDEEKVSDKSKNDANGAGRGRVQAGRQQKRRRPAGRQKRR